MYETRFIHIDTLEHMAEPEQFAVFATANRYANEKIPLREGALAYVVNLENNPDQVQVAYICLNGHHDRHGSISMVDECCSDPVQDLPKRARKTLAYFAKRAKENKAKEVLGDILLSIHWFQGNKDKPMEDHREQLERVEYKLKNARNVLPEHADGFDAAAKFWPVKMRKQAAVRAGAAGRIVQRIAVSILGRELEV